MAVEVLSYQFSKKFERFYEEQKELLRLGGIVFLPMSEHPQQRQYGGHYGTTILNEDGRGLEVYLNPKCFNRHPAEERELVAEIIAVHEILHRWTISKGFPEVQGANVYPELAERFINLFHHRVINLEMDKLGYDYSIPDRMVAQRFLDGVERERPLPTYDASYPRFSLLIMVLATGRDQFTSEEFEKVIPYFAYSNPEILRRGDLCANLIEESKCWDSPAVMFDIMKEVRDILELESNIIDFRNPETGEWNDPTSQ